MTALCRKALSSLSSNTLRLISQDTVGVYANALKYILGSMSLLGNCIVTLLYKRLYVLKLNPDVNWIVSLCLSFGVISFYSGTVFIVTVAQSHGHGSLPTPTRFLRVKEPTVNQKCQENIKSLDIEVIRFATGRKVYGRKLFRG